MSRREYVLRAGLGGEGGGSGMEDRSSTGDGGSDRGDNGSTSTSGSGSCDTDGVIWFLRALYFGGALAQDGASLTWLASDSLSEPFSVGSVDWEKI